MLMILRLELLSKEYWSRIRISICEEFM